MLAERDSGLQLFAADGAIDGAPGHVGPFAFEAHGQRSATMHVGNFAVGMTARPHLVGFGDQALIPFIAARASLREFVFGWALAGADEDAVIVEIGRASCRERVYACV